MNAGWFATRPVGGVRPGDHGWLAYSGPQERDRVIGSFVNEGLETGEKVVYVTDTPPERLPGVGPRTRLALCGDTGPRQLRVIPREKACLDGRGRFDPDLLLDTLGREVDRTFDEGFRAVRLTTDFSWVLDGTGPSGLSRMLGCEHEFGDAVSPSTMAMAICQLDRNACPPDQLDALREAHEVLVEVDPDFDDGILRIVPTFAPAGLRLEGELDAARHAVLVESLSRLKPGGRPVHLDLSHLGFLDLAGLSLLAQQAVLRPGGRPLVLDHLPADVESIIEMVGWHRFPGLARGKEAPHR